MEIFPIIQPELFERDASDADNVCVDVAWENGEPVLEKGNPVFTSGAEAVKSWAERCLLTEKGEYEAQSTEYGAALAEIAGTDGTDAESIKNEVRRALLRNEYILSVDDITTAKTDDKLEISCRLTTTEEDEVDIHAV